MANQIICNHKLQLANGSFDLTQPESDLLPIVQYITDYWMTQYYGKSMGTYKHIIVLDEDTCEIEIDRTLPEDACCALGPQFIGEYDESLLTGLEREHFGLHPGSTSKITPLVAPLLPFGSAFYTPDISFSKVLKYLNKRATGEEIQRIKYTITTTTLKVYFKFARTTSGNTKRYADDVHDLEMELGDTLDNHRGETLSWPLWEMGEICARKYLKKKSYQGLIGYLKKTYDINLDIKDC